MPDQIVVNIEVETRHGFKYLVVRVMKREHLDQLRPSKLADHPLNISEGMFAEYAGLAGLELSGHFANDGALIGFRPMFYQAAFIELYRSKAMTAMLTKIDREFTKAQVREAGDTYMAFCKAIGAKSVALNRTPQITRLPDCDWRFAPIEEGRERLRALIADFAKAA